MCRPSKKRLQGVRIFLRLINNMTMYKQKYAIGLHFIKQCIFCSATALPEYTLRPKEC